MRRKPEAETLMRKALAIRQMALGEAVPSVSDSRRELTIILALHQVANPSGH